MQASIILSLLLVSAVQAAEGGASNDYHHPIVPIDIDIDDTLSHPTPSPSTNTEHDDTTTSASPTSDTRHIPSSFHSKMSSTLNQLHSSATSTNSIMHHPNTNNPKVSSNTNTPTSNPTASHVLSVTDPAPNKLFRQVEHLTFTAQLEKDTISFSDNNSVYCNSKQEEDGRYTTLDIIPYYYQMESSDKESMMMHNQKINNSILSALSGILTCDDTIEDVEEDIRRLREGSVVGAYIDNEECKSLDHITLSLSFISHKY